MGRFAGPAAAVALGMWAAPSFAQLNAEDFVDVNIRGIGEVLARSLDVNLQEFIDLGSVRVPIALAATVCDVQMEVLAASIVGSPARCDSTSTTAALTEIVWNLLPRK